LIYTIDPSRFIATGEDAAEFRELARIVLGYYEPRTEFERMMVHRLCYLLWQVRRLQRFELAILGETVASLDVPMSPGEDSAGGQRLDRVTAVLDLQIKLDAAIRQHIRILSDLFGGRRPQTTEQHIEENISVRKQTEPVERIAPPSIPNKIAPEVPVETYTPNRPAVVRTMAAPQFHFGPKRRTPSCS
jgi:hypothetical protein